MPRSISDILKHSDLCGALLILGDDNWIGMWLPLNGRTDHVRAARKSNLGDTLARAAVANR